MVTYYNRSDMGKFAAWFAKQIKEGKKEVDASGEYNINHSDFENWLNSLHK